jgi:hypothetical protein
MRTSTWNIPLFALLIPLAGCGGSTASVVIGPEGGTLQGDGGAEVIVPAGALDGEVELSIEEGVSPEDVGAAALPEDFSAVTTVVLTPHGTAFSEPATLGLPYSAADLSGAESELVVMRLDDLSDTEWEPHGDITAADDMATTLIDGFSIYSLATVAQGACPCWSGAEMADWKAAAKADGYTTRNSTVNTGRQLSQTCNFVSTGSGAVQAMHSVSTRNGQSWCVSSGNTAYGGSSPPASTTLDASQYGVCRALLTAACFHDRSAVQLGVYSSSIPSGETVSVTVTATTSSGATTSTDLTLSLIDELYWSPTVYDAGTTYTVSIASQPASATCSVIAPTGTLGKDNVAVEVDCDTTTASACDDLRGTWTVTAGDNENGMNTAEAELELVDVPASWDQALGTDGTFYELVQGSNRSGMFVQYVSQTQIVGLNDSPCDHCPMYSEEEIYSCDASTGAQELYLRYQESGWIFELTFVR